MEEWAKRKKDHPKNFKLHIEGGDGRTKSLRSLFKDENFNKKRLSIEDQNMGFKHKIEQQPDPPPVSGGESSAPDHVHDLGEQKHIKTGKKTKLKTDVKTATDILDEKLKKPNKTQPAKARRQRRGQEAEATSKECGTKQSCARKGRPASPRAGSFG